jgi:hypothetical protein
MWATAILAISLGLICGGVSNRSILAIYFGTAFITAWLGGVIGFVIGGRAYIPPGMITGYVALILGVPMPWRQIAWQLGRLVGIN